MSACAGRKATVASPAQAAAVLVLCAAWLQGCADVKGEEEKAAAESEAEAAKQRALQTCPAAQFQGNGYVQVSHAGQEVKVLCPADLVYSGPPLECNWVDRVCVAAEMADLDPDFCMDQFNFTTRGQGLSKWPTGVDPVLVSPARGGMDQSPSAQGVNGRRRGSDMLPKVVDAKDLMCAEEPYVDLDFQTAVITHSNLFGQGPDTDEPQSLIYEGIGVLKGGQRVDLEVSAPVAVPADTSASPERNGRGGSIARVSINSTTPVSLRFRFKLYRTNKPVVVPKVFITLLGISRGDGEDFQVIANDISEYHLSKDSIVKVRRMTAESYAFGGIKQNIDPKAVVAKDLSKASVTELYLDLLGRSAAIVFRNMSEFTLSVRSAGAAQDFEFAGRSTIASHKTGRKVLCQHSRKPKKVEEDRFLKREDVPQKEVSKSSFSGAATLLAVAACFVLLAAVVAGVAFHWMYASKKPGTPGSAVAGYKVFSQSEI